MAFYVKRIAGFFLMSYGCAVTSTYVIEGQWSGVPALYLLIVGVGAAILPHGKPVNTTLDIELYDEDEQWLL